MNKFQYKVQGVDYDVEIEELEGNVATTPAAPQQAAQPAPIVNQAPNPGTGTGSQVKSPLPGTITSINVKVGDVVKDGDTVVVLEAMKMQNNIETEFSGTVTSILVNQGDSVLEGAVLLTIA